jgi:serine/threonine protein kinase/tetratricopeptide (TPR) repeat protein
MITAALTVTGFSFQPSMKVGKTMLGKTLVDRYRIDAELGHGGMGIVYRGYDLRLARPVAIKMISSSNLGSQARSRLLAEAQAVARLNHPNIVTVYDAIEAEGAPCIIMELVEGGTLRAVALPGVKESIEFARQISAALVHAHARGIIHRDIKPDNVLLAPGRIVKLNDFGLARRMDTPHVSDAGLLIGTFAYLAPELIQGDDPSPQSDLYALGVLLYELLTGDLPFKGNDVSQLFAALLRGNPPSARAHNPQVPEMLNDLVMQLLSRRPHERPESAQAVEAALTVMQSDRLLTQAFGGEPPSASELSKLAESRAKARSDWDKDWRRKSYPKSSVPVLGPGEKEQIFSNRKNELARCLEHLSDHRLLVITGMPGIGKSTLARALLEFMPAGAPPPFWYDFDRQKGSGNTLGVLLDRIAAYLERCLGGSVREEILSFRDSPNRQASVHDVDIMVDFLNQNTSLWLVFDNLEAALARGGNGFLDEGLELLFDGLKSNGHNARIVITSPLVPILQDGEFLLEFGSQPMTLQGLDESSAINCLRANGLQDFSDEVLAPVTRLVDGHPFALKHVARYIVTMGVQAALDNLEGGLDGFLEHFQANMQQRLSEAEYGALQQLTVLQRDIPIDGLCKTAQARPAMIERLKEAGLLEKNQAGNFWLPSLIRSSLRLDDPAQNRPAHLRAMEFYRKQKRALAPREIEEYAGVLEWHYHAIQAGDPASAYEAVFSTGMLHSLEQWNEYHLLSGLCESIHSLAGNSAGSLTALQHSSLDHILGNAYFNQRKVSESVAAYRRALATLSDRDDAYIRARTLIHLGEALNVQMEQAAALDCLQQARALLAETPDELLSAQALQLEGSVNVAQGNLEQAIACLEAAKSKYEALVEPRSVAYVTGDLGIAYYYSNQFDKAAENYRLATQTCQQVRDVLGELVGHLNLGDLFLQQEKYEQACQELELALSLARKKKLARDELSAGIYLAQAQVARGMYAEAQAGLDQLTVLLADGQTSVFSGQAFCLRASLEWRQGRMLEARNYFKSAFELLKGEACAYERARAQLEYAAYLRQLGQAAPARMALLEARKDFETINSQLGLRSVEKALLELGSQ